jgi:cellulose synthase/poly-beta-1,6-N-acetylglucosamine synthase-like glycosyltransferase
LHWIALFRRKNASAQISFDRKTKYNGMLSIVIPIHNEEPSILPLYDRLTAVLESMQKPYEIIVGG